MTTSTVWRRWSAVFVAVLVFTPLLNLPVKQTYAAASGVTTLTGAVTVSDPYIRSTYPEHYVALIDLTAFIARDFDLPLPDTTQVTTGLVGDWATGATFALPLPIAPRGDVNDVAHGQAGDGVQIFSLDLQANLAGDPFLGRDEFSGWSTSLTSLEATFDTGEVTGGRLVVWAPDAGQRFPSGFGDDGKLFTSDDPVVPIPDGWTVVDLDVQPFAQLREPMVEVPILEGDAALKDYSDLSFTEAFDRLVADLRVRYPFTEEKGIDWDAIIAEIRPSVAFAEQRYDVLAFNVAMMYFALKFEDGHVAVTPPLQWIFRQFAGGIGVELGVTDDRRLVVRCVAPNLPAANAGIQPAAEIVGWNGDDPLTVLKAAPEIFSSSTVHYREMLQALWMTRMQPGDTVSITYRNPSAGETATAQVTAVEDIDGLIEEPCGIERDDPVEMPVTVDVLPSGVGLITVNTFSDDTILMTHAWEWAIQRLNDLGVRGLIVDVRGNGGGNGWIATYFAGSFTSEPFVLNEAFVTAGSDDRYEVGTTAVEVSPKQWTKPVAVLIDERCASACELFAAAVAFDPTHLIVGRTPTAGAEGGVMPWVLPGGLDFQAPVVGFQHPDGSIFLEGVGVVPNVTAPSTPETLVIAPGVDPTLEVAVSSLLG